MHRKANFNHRSAKSRSVSVLHATVMAAALSMIYPQFALAQTAPQATQSTEEVVVTATRVNRSGFTAPTPTTVLGSEQIAQKVQTSLGDIINDVPSFRASTSPGTSGPGLARGAQTTADMRGLGAARTLVLFDGQRAVPATSTGISDLNLIPTLLIDRVDIVTGGASASWGSDAVAGVVNVVIKKHFNGLLADLMVGQSQYHDARQTRFAIAGGTDFADGRGHVIAGLDYDNNKGVGDQFTRPWGRENYSSYTNACSGVAGTPVAASAGCTGNVANGLPRTLLVPNVYVANATTGGLITAVSGGAPASLRGTVFGAGGVPYAFPGVPYVLPTGSLTGATQIVGTGPIPGAFASANNQLLWAPSKRYNGLARVSFDLTDNLTAFASLLYARVESKTNTFPTLNTLTISQGNPYIPASIAAQLPVGSSFSLGRYTEDSFGPATSNTLNKTYNFSAGLQGNFGAGWSWDLNGESGRNTLDQWGNLVVTQNLLNATDAVLSNGQIVCRSTLTNLGNGCVPFNVFGNGSPSAVAEAYIHAREYQRQITRQQAAAFVLRGEPFATPSGPVSLATGLEYRKEQVNTTVDPIAQARFNAQTAGASAATLATLGYVNSNPTPLQGSYNIREAFAETVVPLQNKTAFARSLDLTLAARYTDYSTSGSVKTWKVGLVWAPVDELKLRVTRSLDIRAPNLVELYSPGTTGTTNTLTNPFLGGINAGFVRTFNSGNANLKPEKSNNLTYGFVYTPNWVRNLSLSADYYDVRITDAIGTVNSQTAINQCAAGNAVLCQLVIRDAANNILQVNLQSINISSFEATGIDFQASYRARLADWIGNAPGDLSFNLSANYTISAIIDDRIIGPINRAGDVGASTGNGGFGRPKWIANLSTTYRYNRLSAGVQLRYLDHGYINILNAEGVTGQPAAPGATGTTINDNIVPSITYVNLNGSYDLVKNDKYTLQLYGVINNAGNRKPPVDPAGAGSTNPAFYDVIGRAYKLGLRMTY